MVLNPLVLVRASLLGHLADSRGGLIGGNFILG